MQTDTFKHMCHLSDKLHVTTFVRVNIDKVENEEPLTREQAGCLSTRVTHGMAARSKT